MGKMYASYACLCKQRVVAYINKRNASCWLDCMQTLELRFCVTMIIIMDVLLMVMIANSDSRHEIIQLTCILRDENVYRWIMVGYSECLQTVVCSDYDYDCFEACITFVNINQCTQYKFPCCLLVVVINRYKNVFVIRCFSLQLCSNEFGPTVATLHES